MKKNKKVLILTRSFLPYYPTLGGVLRVLKTLRYLHENGFEVHILAAEGLKISYFGYDKFLSDYHVHYFKDPLKVIENKIHLNSLDAKGLDSKGKRFKTLLKNFILYFMLPDHAVVCVKTAYKEAERLINKYNIENVIISVPPHSTLIAGYRLKKHLGNKINLIADYRDSWNTTAIFKKRNPIFFYFCKKMERKILRIIDHYVCVSKPMLDKIEKLYNLPDLRFKSRVVMNGFKTDKPVSFVHNQISDKIKIGYFGKISDSPSSFRDPTLLFEFIKEKYPDKFEIFIYGSQNILKKYSFVKSFSNVNHDEALEIMRQMDMLLLIHTQHDGADEVITGKFFDYLTAGRPVLVYGPLSMEASRLVREYKFGYELGILPEDMENFESTFEIIINHFKSGKLIKYTIEDIKSFSMEAQFSQYLDILR